MNYLRSHYYTDQGPDPPLAAGGTFDSLRHFDGNYQLTSGETTTQSSSNHHRAGVTTDVEKLVEKLQIFMFPDLSCCLIIRWWRQQPHLLPSECRLKPFSFGWLWCDDPTLAPDRTQSRTLRPPGWDCLGKSETPPALQLHWKKTLYIYMCCKSK